MEDRVHLKWRLNARNTNQLHQESALFYGFRAIAQRLVGKDATEAEQSMRKSTALVETHELQWSWKEIDDWLKRTKVAPDRKAAIEKIVGELKVAIPDVPERSATNNAPPRDQRPAEITKDDPAIVLVRGKNIHGDMIYCYLRIKSSQAKKLEAALQAAGDGKFAVSDYGTVLASGKGDPPPDVVAEIHKKYPQSKEIPVLYKGKDAAKKSETPVEQRSKK